jgi:NAD(P)H-dependent FMN reductase
MLDIAVVLGSTRPGRRGEMVARWVVECAQRHPSVLAGAARFSLLDIAKFALPLLDEPTPPLLGAGVHEHTRRWAAAIRPMDAFVFVTPEYNHSLPAALKNAIDYLYAEWGNKAAAAVGYGVQGGVRAVEHLRAVLGEVSVVMVRTQVALSLFDDFRIEDPSAPGVLEPRAHHEKVLAEALDELVRWARVLAPLRAAPEPERAA